jgi:predicted RNase H-like HicB family nuclease
MKYVYPATLHPEPEGGYSVWFEGLSGCASQGDTLAEAIEMARDALCGWLNSSIDRGEAIPAPPALSDIPLESGQFASLIDADVDAYRQANDMRSITRAVTQCSVKPLALTTGRRKGGKPIPDMDEPLAIETDLTDEEKAIVAQGKRERAEHPESYISLTEYINSRDGAADV